MFRAPTVNAVLAVALAGLGCAGVAATATPSPDGGGAADTAVDLAWDAGQTVPGIDAPLDVIFVPPDDAGMCQRELRAVVRDFRSGEKDGQPKHPDFEAKVAVDPGIVTSML